MVFTTTTAKKKEKKKKILDWYVHIHRSNFYIFSPIEILVHLITIKILLSFFFCCKFKLIIYPFPKSFYCESFHLSDLTDPRFIISLPRIVNNPGWKNFLDLFLFFIQSTRDIVTRLLLSPTLKWHRPNIKRNGVARSQRFLTYNLIRLFTVVHLLLFSPGLCQWRAFLGRCKLTRARLGTHGEF